MSLNVQQVTPGAPRRDAGRLCVSGVWSALHRAGILAFLIAWEPMSLVSFFLVVEDHHQPESRRAGFVYLTMTHVGGAFLVAAFLALATAAGSLDFGALRLAAPRLDPLVRDLVFLAALIGFGSKAGLIPLHVWLPRAHPAAPSYASTLMSGVMLKVAVYGLLRVGWELAGPGPSWWGGLLLAMDRVEQRRRYIELTV